MRAYCPPFPAADASRARARAVGILKLGNVMNLMGTHVLCAHARALAQQAVLTRMRCATPGPAVISGFQTAASVSIALGQFKGLFGYGARPLPAVCCAALALCAAPRCAALRALRGAALRCTLCAALRAQRLADPSFAGLCFLQARTSPRPPTWTR